MSTVWVNKDTLFDKVVVVAEDAIVTADVDDNALEETKRRIEAGEAPLNVLGEKATLIPYFSIKKVEVDEADTDIDIDYKTEKESKDKTLSFVDIETRLSAFKEIQSHLGDKFTSLTEQYNVARAAYAPLMALSIIGFVTWLLHGAAAAISGGQEADISGRHKGIKYLFYWALDLLGPTGVVVAGVLCMLVAAFSLVKRIKQPPVITTLKEGEQKPGGIAGTIFKYGILAGIWYLFAPAIMAAVFS